MAQPSPLRNRTLYGASDGTIFPDQGSAEGWQRAGRPVGGAPAAPAPSAAPPAAPSVGMPPGQASERIGQRFLRYGKNLSSVANIVGNAAYEIAGPGGLAETARTQGTDAAMAQAPNALGRVAGSEVGMQLGAKVGSKLPGLWKVPGVVGGAALGNYLGRQGGDQAVSGLQRLNAGPYSKALDMGDAAASAVSPTGVVGAVGRGLRGFLNADGSINSRFASGLAGVLAGSDAAVSPLRGMAGVGATQVPASVGAGSGQVTPRRPQATLLENGAPLPESALTPPTPFNQVKGAPSGGVVASAGQVSPNFFYGRKTGLRSLPATLQADREAAAKAADAVVPQIAAPSNMADRISLRGTQGGTIRNPNAMSTTDRIASLGGDPRLKGFPSLRRAMADQIMAEDKRYDDQFNKSQDINAQAELAQAKMQADAHDAFANRRLKADMFNTAAREGRRTTDQTFQLGVADRMLQASGLRGTGSRLAGAQAASGKPISDRYDELRDDYLKRNPSASWAEASQFAADTAASEGAKATDSRGVYGADRLRAAGYSQAMADVDPSSASWFGERWGRKAVNALSGMSDGSGQTTPGTDSDPSDYTFRPIGLRERFASALLPGVDLTDDVVATDSRTGRSRLVPSSVLGGQSPDATNILNRFRRQNQGLGD